MKVKACRRIRRVSKTRSEERRRWRRREKEASWLPQRCGWQTNPAGEEANDSNIRGVKMGKAGEGRQEPLESHQIG